MLTPFGQLKIGQRFHAGKSLTCGTNRVMSWTEFEKISKSKAISTKTVAKGNIRHTSEEHAFSYVRKVFLLVGDELKNPCYLKFENDEDGICAYVIENECGYVVTFRDVEAMKTLGTKICISEEQGINYAKSFVQQVPLRKVV